MTELTQPWNITTLTDGLSQAAIEKLYDAGLAAKLATHANTDTTRERIRNEKVKAFREAYIKVRTSNIVLDHASAIELVKMIFIEADLLTYEDTQ